MRKIELANYIKLVDSYAELLESRPYGMRYKALYKTVHVLVYFLPIMSICSGVWFVKSTFDLLFQPMVALITSGIVILIWEYAKSVSISSLFQSKYRKEPIGLLTILALLFSLGSIYFSCKGIDQWYVEVKLDTTEITANYASEKSSLDSIADTRKSFYEIKLLHLDKASKKRWGQMLSKEENLRVLQYEDRLRQIDLNLQNDKKKLEDTYQTNLKKLRNESEEPRIILVILFLLIDLGIAFGYWFIVYYQYQSVNELSTLIKIKPDWKTALTTLHQELHDHDIKHGNYNDKGGLPSTDPLSSIKEKEEALLSAIHNGCRDMRKLCSLGFNPSQVKQALKEQN
ncbi:hypothetical protein [Flammeovirga pacifica]|uniref:DUF4407 domain-containing protein n=1 Tax=Flammeovirga pacifica TaxID=915059 RepID=A0A1S1YVV6_FLAPC|nr:hypothetical protein [Flammeovirga pacifica]OHX65130.1 hypothetical protein NH26_01550 [Flammeovirga pacifica]